MITWGQISLQDASSPVIEEFLFFHDHTLVILSFILTVVAIRIARVLIRKTMVTGLLQGQALEALWTALPALILIQVAIPSLLLLYALDEGWGSHLTIKAIGHQWYWSYEYSDFGVCGEGVEFDAYILPYERGAQFRLLDVDNRTVVPWGRRVRVLIGSADVLHSWTVPRIGVKADACPGRLNQVKFLRHRPGLFFGQCSEICGANHRFIPIVLEVARGKAFVRWLDSRIERGK